MAYVEKHQVQKRRNRWSPHLAGVAAQPGGVCTASVPLDLDPSNCLPLPRGSLAPADNHGPGYAPYGHQIAHSTCVIARAFGDAVQAPLHRESSDVVAIQSVKIFGSHFVAAFPEASRIVSTNGFPDICRSEE